MKILAIMMMSIFLGACSSSNGFNRGELRSEISPSVQISEESIKKALEAKPQLPSPFKLGLYFEAPNQSNQNYSNRHLWEWKLEDKELIKSATNELVTDGNISEVVVLNSSIVEGEGNIAIRLAAARAGVDAIVIVRGTSAIDTYNNPLGITYILLVTGAFVPGTVQDSLFMVNATMWDVRNEYLYMSAEAEGEVSETRPAFFSEKKRVVGKAKGVALVSLKDEIERQLNVLNK